MMNATRRELMRALGMAPIAGPSMVKQLAAAVQENALAQAAVQAAGVTTGVPLGATPPGLAVLGKALFGHIEQLNKDAHDEFHRSTLCRIGGVDADLAVLRSVSPTYKAAMQKRRDQEFMAVTTAASKLLWGQ